jgi:hypothetical protein
MSNKLPPDAPKPSIDLLAEEEIERVAQTEIQRVSDQLVYKEEQSLSRRERLREFKITEAKDVHQARIQYLFKLFCLIVGWLAVVVVFVGLTGLRAWHFELSDGVLIALITSTTATVLGLFIVAAKWLYPAPLPKGPKSEDDDQT